MIQLRESRNRPKGVLVVFEGIDGGGKTTQARRLVRFLQARGYPVLLSREPTDGPWGQRIRNMAREGHRPLDPEEEHHLFLEDRREHVREVILPALREGKVVILDRYYLSNMAYQGARGLDPERIRRENEAFAPRPHLVFILDLPPEVALARIHRGRGPRTAFEEKNDLDRVRALFQSFKGPGIHHLDARVSEEVLARLIQAHWLAFEQTWNTKEDPKGDSIPRNP